MSGTTINQDRKPSSEHTSTNPGLPLLSKSQPSYHIV